MPPSFGSLKSSGKKKSKPKATLAKGAKLAATSATVGNERVRKIIVNLIFIVYFFLLFEGVLRKWALPGFQAMLFFIRDPFVLLIYILAWRNKLWPKWTPIFSFGVILAALYIPLAMAQYASLDIPSKVVAYGWRCYFYYLPLAFIIGSQFRAKDMNNLVKITLWIAIPISVLCYQQFKAPADDLINQSYGGESSMLVANGIVRTSGTFTIGAAQSLFIGSVAAMLFAVWLMPKKDRPIGQGVLLLASLATITMTAVSGSRGGFFIVALVCIAGIVCVRLIHPNKLNVKKLMIIPALLVTGVALWVTVFKTAFEAMAKRQSEANGTEGGTVVRALSVFINFLAYVPRLTFIGLGLGSCTNAAANMMTNTIMIEDEWSRAIMESGILGFAYVFWRIWFTYYIGSLAYRATARTRNPLPLLLFGFVGLVVLNGEMTMQGTVYGYGWLFAGFTMAASRMTVNANKSTTALGAPLGQKFSKPIST